MEQLLTGWPLRHLAALPYDPLTCSDLYALLQFFFSSPCAYFLSSFSPFSRQASVPLQFSPNAARNFELQQHCGHFLPARSCIIQGRIYTLTPVVLETDGARPKLQARLRDSPTSWEFLVLALTFSTFRCLIRYRPGAWWDSSGRCRIL